MPNLSKTIEEQKERNRRAFYPTVQVRPEDREKYKVVQPILQNALDAWYKDASSHLDQITEQTSHAILKTVVEVLNELGNEPIKLEWYLPLVKDWDKTYDSAFQEGYSKAKSEVQTIINNVIEGK